MNKEKKFLAMIFRMKHINRWSLMYNTYTENLSVHTLECAYITQFLAVIGNVYFNKNYDINKLSTIALYHDVTEIITGDMPTPIKYYNEDIKKAYKSIENVAATKLLDMMPSKMQSAYKEYITPNLTKEEKELIKMSDTLCAYIKCIKEVNSGNKEFLQAGDQILNKLEEKRKESSELELFIDEYLDTFSMSLDELGGIL